MRIIIVLTILAFSFSLFVNCNSAFAQTSTDSASSSADILQDLGSLDEGGAIEVGESLISPASPLYFLKIIREKIESIFGGSTEVKAMREVEFAHRRLRETRALIKGKRQDLIEATMDRYRFHLDQAGNLADNEELQIKVGEAIARHLDVLQRVYDQVGNPRAKMAIRISIERAEEHNRLLLERLNLINQQKLIRKVALRQAQACKFLQREASASGFNEMEREYLKKKVRQCLENVNMNLKDELLEIKGRRQATPSSGIR